MVQIKSHLQRALSLLASQFQDRLPNGSMTNFQKLVNVLIEPFQELEDVKWQLKTERWIETSIGEQLDLLATLFNLTRNINESDEDFRERITFQIFINQSSGTPEEIMRILLFLTEAQKVGFKDLFPAYFELETDGLKFPSPPNDLNDAIFQASPAGVNYAPIYVSYGEDILLTLSGDILQSELYVAPNTSDPSELTTLEMEPYGALLNVLSGAVEDQFGYGSLDELGVPQEVAGVLSDVIQKGGNFPPIRFS